MVAARDRAAIAEGEMGRRDAEIASLREQLQNAQDRGAELQRLFEKERATSAAAIGELESRRRVRWRLVKRYQHTLRQPDPRSAVNPLSPLTATPST